MMIPQVFLEQLLVLHQIFRLYAYLLFYGQLVLVEVCRVGRLYFSATDIKC